MSDLEQRIKERAYRLWEEEGYPEGRDEAHWELARELIAIEDSAHLLLRPAPIEGADGPSGEPVEEASVATGGDIPTIVDQGEQQYPPSAPYRSTK